MQHVGFILGSEGVFGHGWNMAWMDGRMDGREIGTIESVPIGYSRLDNRVPAGSFALIAVWVFMILCEMMCASKIEASLLY
jgi:hypothetical protein